MKIRILFIFIFVLFTTALVGCEKKEILNYNQAKKQVAEQLSSPTVASQILNTKKKVSIEGKLYDLLKFTLVYDNDFFIYDPAVNTSNIATIKTKENNVNLTNTDGKEVNVNFFTSDKFKLKISFINVKTSEIIEFEYERRLQVY